MTDNARNEDRASEGGLTDREQWIIRGSIGFLQRFDLGEIEPDGEELGHLAAVLAGSVDPCTSEEIAYIKVRDMDENMVRVILTSHVDQVVVNHREIKRRAKEQNDQENKTSDAIVDQVAPLADYDEELTLL